MISETFPVALDPLKKIPNWVCWRFVWKVDKKGAGKWDKPPYRPKNPRQLAKNNDPSTWGTYEQALAAFEVGKCDGIGFNFLGTDIAAFDIDKCRDRATGQIAPVAMEIVNRATSYTEMTPSGTGLRVVGYGFGAKVHRKQKIPGSSVEIESYRGAERYITITGNPLPGTLDRWPHMIDIGNVIDTVVVELDGFKDEARQDKASQDNARQDLDDEFAAMPQNANAAPAGADDYTGDAFLPGNLIELIEKGVPPQADLSAAFHHAVCWLGDRGWSATRIEGRIAGKPIVPERFAKRLDQEIARCLRKAKANTQQQRAGSNSNARLGNGVALDDFYAYMPNHQYIFVPTREMWPSSSVNSRLPKVPLLKKNGAPILDENGKPKHSTPSVWLDKHRPVEQMTWAPGEPPIIANKLIAEGGWIERQGVATFNLYRPLAVRQGNSANADRWIELVQRIYPNDANHIITYCAHRIQHPAVKINHGILLGGSTGIGKDTMLEPLKLGVGPWNFKEVSPQDIMSPYNDYLRCVVLRISEAHDLGDVSRYAFYDRMKTILATPPDVIRVNGKYIPQHYVVNVTGVFYTTNNRFDSIYLPPNDRRTYVAWSEVRSEEFATDFWKSLWAWYGARGLEDVVAYLAEYDVSKFDPKAPPKKTEAFWQIVGAGASPDNSELADILDALGAKESAKDAEGNPCAPVVTTLAKVLAEASTEQFDWWNDRKNRRGIPHKFEACGYTPVRNDAAKDGLWVINGKRQVIYGRMDATLSDRIKAAVTLAQTPTRKR